MCGGLAGALEIARWQNRSVVITGGHSAFPMDFWTAFSPDRHFCCRIQGSLPADVHDVSYQRHEFHKGSTDPTVYISELAPELRRRVDNLCGFTLCSNTTDVISDQFAIIPQRYIYTYFSDINYTKPGKMPEDTLSVHMVNNNVKFAPFSLRMCIHRSGKPLTCPSIQDRLLRCS